MTRYLLVAHQTAGSPELRKHVRQIIAHNPTSEFTVLVPATPVSKLFTWREEDAITIARKNLEHSVALLQETGASVSRTVIGDRSPLDAIVDELRDQSAYDESIICTFPPGASRWLRLDLITQAERRTGLRVTHVIARPSPAGKARPAGSAAVQSPSRAGAPGDEVPGAADGPSIREQQRTAIAEAEVGSLWLPPLDRDRLPEHMREFWDRLDEGRGVANVFQAMSHNRSLLHAYVEMLNALWNEAGLDDQTRELVILRTALNCCNVYVWHRHARIARELAIPDNRILALEHWTSTGRPCFDEREGAVLAYVDALNANRRPPARVDRLLTSYYSPDAIVGLTLLIGFYHMTCTFTHALRVEVEEPFVGWQLTE